MSMIIIFYDRNVHAEEDLICQYNNSEIIVGCIREFLHHQEEILVCKGIFLPTRQDLCINVLLQERRDSIANALELHPMG